MQSNAVRMFPTLCLLKPIVTKRNGAPVKNDHWLFVTLCIAANLVITLPAIAQDAANGDTIRIATFNCSLNRDKSGDLLRDLQSGNNKQAREVAAILRTVRPDIVLLNEFDYDSADASIDAFRKDYLEATGDWTSQPALKLQHAYSGPVNTGVPSGLDLDHDGKTDGWGDAFGFGRFPGQYGMVILSRFPIDAAAARSFQNLLWKNMPISAVPADITSGAEPWYSESDLATLSDDALISRVQTMSAIAPSAVQLLEPGPAIRTIQQKLAGVLAIGFFYRSEVMVEILLKRVGLLIAWGLP